ncbi:MAG: chromosome segregation protein SMC [Candidatus Methylacidiphilales bacterium]
MKSIEAVGFKSFADPTVLEFDRGVTAVVGPNGCGKSNVLDAIRWVLGEQSAKALRGGSMQDVIFSGSDSRKPLGMAEVSLNFCECEDSLGTDYHEVRITRRVFRDGHGEYEINKTPCRLRDIHRLFMDTGIGRSAYSIMEQGRIDQILSSKPEERRAVFEEAAGITRFKSQKKEALRKLEATEANILRLSDIVKEVSRQIGSLQRQAAKAKRYQEYFERLKLLDTHLAAHEYLEIRTELESGLSLVQALQLEFNTLQSGLDEKEQLLKEKRRELETLIHRIQQLDQQKNTVDNRLTTSTQQIEYHQNRIAEMEELKERNRSSLVSIDEKQTIQTGQLQHTEQEASVINSELAAISDELTAATGQLDSIKASLAENQTQRATANNRIGAVEEQINRIRQEKAGLEARRTAHGERLQQLQAERPLMLSQHEEALKALATAEAACQENARSLADRKNSLTEAENRLSSQQHKLNEAETSRQKAEADQQQTTLRIQTLNEVISSRQDFSGITRELIQSWQHAGVKGTLVERLHIRSGYGEALRTCLGAAWEAVWIEQPDQIESIIASLQNSVVLAYDTPETKTKSWLKFFERTPSASAIHFISPDPGVESLARRLLKPFLIAETPEEAAVMRKNYPSYHIVSRDGQAWFHEGWQQRGTRSSPAASMVEYEHDLRALALKLPALDTLVVESRSLCTALKSELDSLARIAHQKRQELTHAEAHQRDLDLQLKTRHHDVETCEKNIQRIDQESDKLTRQGSPSDADLKELDAVMEARLLERKEAAIQLESLQQDQLRVADQLEQHNQKVTEIRVREAAVRQRLKSVEQQKHSITARLQELAEAKTTALAEIADYDQKLQTSTASIQEARLAISGATAELESLSQTLDQESSLRLRLMSELEQLDENTPGQRKQASAIQGRFGKEEVQVAQSRMKLESLVSRISKTYDLDLHHWKPGLNTPHTQNELRRLELHPVEGVLETHSEQLEAWISVDSLFRDPAQDELLGQENPDWDAVRIQIDDIRDKIDRMGPVNVEAIEEYEELEDRQHFLKQQEEDLLRSRDQLHEAIKRINLTTKVMFAETFEKVRHNFRDMFQELFGGGKAELTLEDENDPLECGIDILARPPGKQPQSITLLSGGEKTMTAVALLFAIYMVKPSPFCFLDEMDAPLDESNINRFIRILQRFVKQSQFCVITHNKRTISAADVLYGVTMQEQGVSRLVSMRMNRKEESPLFHNGRDEEEPPNIADAVRSGKVITDGLTS